MSSKTVPAAAVRSPLLSTALLSPPPPVAVAARVSIKQLTVSDQQLILLKSVRVSDSVCTVREVKVNLSRYDIPGAGRK